MNIDRLFGIREENDLTQDDIAKILDVSRVAVSQWETGKAVIPITKLNIFANYFKVSMDFLLSLSSQREINLANKNLDAKVIGKRITLIREKHNLSQRNLAKELNTSSSTICAYEQGKTLILTAFAYQICLNYKVSLDWLCGKIN